jgi:pyruvate formate lyase activating enzyme
MDDKFTLKFCGARHQPVLDTIRAMHERGIWVEVATVVIPAHNDDDDHLKQAADFLASVSRDIPWHLTAFHPDYKMMDVPSTSRESLLRAVEIGRQAGLRYVYTGNTHGWETENTFCPSCGTVVIERYGFTLRNWHLQNGKCAACGTAVAGAGLEEAPHMPQKSANPRAPKPANLCG